MTLGWLYDLFGLSIGSEKVLADLYVGDMFPP
jgi:hypothetical protein